MSKKWYTIHVYSNYEKSVARKLRERIDREGFQDSFGEIFIPTEEVREKNKDNKDVVRERKIYPGYIFIEMEMNDETRYLVKSTPKVTGFLGGSSNNPTPIRRDEIESITRQREETVGKPRPKVEYEVGEWVRIVTGPFEDFSGMVDSVNYDKNKLKVVLQIFDRDTPIEVDIDQVVKSDE